MHPLEKGQECNSIEVHGEAVSLGNALPRWNCDEGFTRLVADDDYVLVAVAVEGKPTCLRPAVGYGLQHQVPVDLIEAIPGIEECSPKAAVWHVAQAGGISGFARVHCWNDSH
jgi:hypothetical protein